MVRLAESAIAAAQVPKPELGYTGERRVYANGYEIRTRVYKVGKPRTAREHWWAKYKYDVFHNDRFVVEATSLRLAELYIGESKKGR